MACVVHTSKDVSPVSTEVCGVCDAMIRLRLSEKDAKLYSMADENRTVTTVKQRDAVMRLRTMFVTHDILGAVG